MAPDPTDLLADRNANKQQFLTAAGQISDAIGSEFFALLVKKLRETLNAECVYIGEFVRGKSERVRTVAVDLGTEQPAAFEFSLARTPDAEVALGKPCVFSTGVQELFPNHGLLADLQIQGFIGVPLNSAQGYPCGILAALYREPLNLDIYFVQSILNAFVARTAAELNRKQADEALRESEQRYHAYVQLNPDACWRIEFSEPIDTALPEKEQLDKVLQFGYVAECNSAFLRRLGLQEAGKIIGATIAEAVPYLQNVDRYINSLIHSGYRYNTIEITRVDARGRRSHSLTSHWGIVEDGKLQRIWGSSRDITELREVEAQFRQAQKFESIGTLAAGIAHDFKNVLMVILGYSSQLLAQTNTDDPAHAELATIQKAANQGAGLADQLLTFSRKPTGEMRLIDLNSLVQGDEQTLRRLLGPKVELVIEVETAPALVRACPGYMHQVLLNLTLNARDAMPNGGRLIVAVSSMDIDEDRPPQLAAIEPGRYVRLSVADNGTGMTPEVEERMFEPFFTTKAERGTGLGLPTVYGIVRQAGGHIQVKTAPNKGATIEIFLPEQSQSNAPIKDA